MSDTAKAVDRNSGKAVQSAEDGAAPALPPPLPRFVQIEPVGQCNLRCQMCPIQFRRDGPPWGPPAFMDFEMYAKLVEGFPELRELHLQGLGEPMMHPRYFDMVAYAAARGVTVSTNTNLTLLDRRRAEQLVRSGRHTVHVSIDGATRATYERIRVWGRFKKVLRNLALLRKAKERLNAATPHIRLVMVLMRQNLHELPALVRLAGRLGIPALFAQHLAHDFGESSLPANYRPMQDYVEEQTLLREEPSRVSAAFAAARTAAGEAGVDLRLPSVRMRLHAAGTAGRDRCQWPWTGAYISYQGLSMPCCMIATPDRMNFGSMSRDGVEKVWNNAPYRRFRAALSSEEPPEICRTCSIYRGTF